MIEDMIKEVNFNDNGLVPAIAQDARSGDVLMLAWMNMEAIQKTIRTGKVHYWSRSRKRLWMKGETSGNTQSIVSMRMDCDGDALLLKVLQKGPACHTGESTCFYTDLTDDSDINIMKLGSAADRSGGSPASQPDTDMMGIMSDLYEVIANRFESPKEGSYTSYLFEKGIDKILKKLGEEATEVVIASKNDKKDEMVYEISDLLYHLLVLMVDKGIYPEDICRELKRRRKSE